MDARLIGYWSESEVHPGSTEYTELGFRADGTGWQYWSSWSTEFVVHRFTWDGAASRLALRLGMVLDGTWSLDGERTRHRVERREHVDTRLTLGCSLTDEPKLELDRPIDEMLGGTQFLFVPGGGADPTLA
ncbi:hypothetical protein MUY14_31810 [Amycolatopsis sp. FBCC-B4732]|uniref:hypothetical protein n=1 Tax=unclassified Amycolatopsis TaxID=2618356 RepID=UPI001FF1B6D2|nr:hypothetical protein [Amycolatopsis sp. FBCC-B4732]UOX86320.1 hypothetical protein MUY14_31810 [Amycolatopsis sp. FBCC-B4732]